MSQQDQIGRRTFVKGAAGVVGMGAMLGALSGSGAISPGFAGATETTDTRASSNADTNVASGSAGSVSGSYIPGTYEASALGKNGPVTLSVTFDSSSIQAIEVVSHSETGDISYVPLAVLPQVILAAQSTNIDSVSGATLSSFAIKSAVDDAIAQAGGDPTALPAFDPTSVSQAMTPGTYVGEAYGKWKKGSIEGERFGSPATIEPTQVEVVVDETSIVSVKVTSCSDTPGFYEVAAERIPGDIVDQQSLFVDTVTGSTLTAAAITSAVAKALTEAGANLAGFAKATPRVSDEETYEVDLCIIGAGTAGTTAALRAVEEGLRHLYREVCAYFRRGVMRDGRACRWKQTRCRNRKRGKRRRGLYQHDELRLLEDRREPRAQHPRAFGSDGRLAARPLGQKWSEGLRRAQGDKRNKHRP